MMNCDQSPKTRKYRPDPRILILQHLACEPPALLADVLHEQGWKTEVVLVQEQRIPERLDDYAGLIVMGGPMSASDTHLDFIAQELALLKQAIKQDFPVLGICLGAQLLAKAAGAEILTSPERELGWHPLFPTSDSKTDALFSSLPAEGLKVFQWHGETFSLPRSAKLLASCPEVPNQAFRLGSCQYGLQFHVEVDARIIRNWIETGKSERRDLGENGIRTILRGIPPHLSVMRSFCKMMCESWLVLIRKRMEKN